MAPVWRVAAVAAFCFPALVLSTSSCTPIYPNCTCQTAALTCADLDSISQSIANAFYATYGGVTTAAEMQVDPAGLSRAAGEMIGATVRLVFHDAAEYSPHDGLRSDGCVNLQAEGQGGIAAAIAMLDPLWLPHCGRISRADFWVLAAQVMMQETCPYSATRRGASDQLFDNANGASRRRLGHGEADIYTFRGRGLLKGAANHDFVVFPFRYGRVDRPNCSYSGPSRMPNAELGVDQITGTLMASMGLTPAQTVALLGAHTLGLANVQRSGYDSYWKDRPDLWDITYYKVLLVNTWNRNNTLRDPATGAPLQQWSIRKGTSGGRNPNAFMTNADMQLLYNINASNPAMNQATQCKAYAAAVDPGNVVLSPSLSTGGCPLLRTNAAAPDFTSWALQFAEGNTPTQDEPGASRWMSTFTDAWRIMTELGYADGELTCPGCVPATCAAMGCTVQDACYGQQDWSLNKNVSWGNWSQAAGVNSASYVAPEDPSPAAASATATSAPASATRTPSRSASASGAPATPTSTASSSAARGSKAFAGALTFSGVPEACFSNPSAVGLLRSSIRAALRNTTAADANTTVVITRVSNVATGATIYTAPAARRLQGAANIRVDYTVTLPASASDAVGAQVASATGGGADAGAAALVAAVTANVRLAAAASSDAQLQSGFAGAAVAAAAPAEAASASGGGSRLTVGAIVGIVIGLLCAAGIVTVVAMKAARRKHVGNLVHAPPRKAGPA